MASLSSQNGLGLSCPYILLCESPGHRLHGNLPCLQRGGEGIHAAHHFFRFPAEGEANRLSPRSILQDRLQLPGCDKGCLWPMAIES